MKLRQSAKFISLIMALSASAMADSTIYTYTGNPYDWFDTNPPPGDKYHFTSANRISGWLELDDTLPLPRVEDYSFSGENINSRIGRFSFTDGISAITHENASSKWFRLFFDGQNQVSRWEVTLSNIPSEAERRPGDEGVRLRTWNSPSFTVASQSSVVQEYFIKDTFGNVGVRTRANVGAFGAPGVWSKREFQQLLINRQFYEKNAEELSWITSGASVLSAGLGGVSATTTAGRLSGLSLLAPSLTGADVSTGLFIVGGVAAGALFFATGGLAAAAVASISLTGAFASYSYNETQEILADPPDPNYAEIYEYSGSETTLDFGIEDSLNAHINKVATASIIAAESLEGVLTSAERAQGAELAGDAGAELAQIEALAMFEDNYKAAAGELGALLKEVPNILTALGFEDSIIDKDAVAALQEDVAMNGIPQETLDLLTDQGLPASTEAEFLNYIASLDPDILPDGMTLFEFYNRAGDSLIAVSAVPIPAGVWLLLSGLGALAGRRAWAAN